VEILPMTAPRSDQARPGPLTRQEADALAAELVGEMIRRWRQSERPLPEEFLARHPVLWEHPEAAADLIYEELCLRQEHGADVPVEQVLRRFPQWRPQLEVLFDCQRILGPRQAPPQFPAAGETLGDFLLLAELGGGAHGRVFLANQLSLGDRPVVLKVAPYEAREHLSLARLQHTHIVPLYCVQDHPARGLRALCMPYFGGATLARLLETLHPQPPARRTGQDLLAALDRASEESRLANAEWPIDPPSEAGAFPHDAVRGENNSPVPCPSQVAGSDSTPARRLLARLSYVEAVCWVGACLADALHYAHERGLVHLDLKPCNVLLAADGQPLLLDFHLSREPIHPDRKGPLWLGGTSGYMSPEQREALEAIRQGRNVTRPVDGLSDVYSLGVVLYEALGGSLPGSGGKLRPLHRRNARVSVGLADVIGKCLADDPRDRYAHAAALANDLRRHLADLPLAGVRNRSLVERWRKWRRRRPHGVALAGMVLAVITAAGAVALGAASHLSGQLDQARTALKDGQSQMDRGDWEGAVVTLQHGLSSARALPFQRDLADALDRSLRLAEQERVSADRAAAARDLHQLADRARFLYGTDRLPPEGLRGLAAACRALWEQRGRVAERLSAPKGDALEPTVRDDLLDLAILWADLQVRLAPPSGEEAARRDALAVLDQAEALFGPSPVLDEERKLHGGMGRADKSVGPTETQSSSSVGPTLLSALPSTAWDHYALARSLVRSGDLERAAVEAKRAVRLQPQGLWPNFYQGLCAYRRGRYADAVTAYSVCIGAAPEATGCFYNRALAYEALGEMGQALDDYDQALRLDPTLAAAAVNRGMLHYRAKRYADALADLQRAEALGEEPATISFDRALVHLARGEESVALEELRRALRHAPHHADARKLLDRLLSQQRHQGARSPTPARSDGVEKSAPASGPESR
jgi:serine/threonine protein kinase/Flp pilus assembly protein TadD